jgi:hypothetical protein
MYIRLLIVVILASVIGLSSCKKNNDAPNVTLTTKLNIINASTDTINFYLNGTRQNNNSSIYPAVSTGYYDVPYGTQDYQFKKMFDTTKSVVQNLFITPQTLDTGKYYSLFITGETADRAFLTIDNLTADPKPDTLYLRFVNASPDAGNLDVAVGDTLKFQNVAFKAASDFVVVGSGLKTFKIYSTGSATPLLTSLPVAMGARRLYTIYTKGKPGGTGDSAFGIAITLNYNQ